MKSHRSAGKQQQDGCRQLNVITHLTQKVEVKINSWWIMELGGSSSIYYFTRCSITRACWDLQSNGGPIRTRVDLRSCATQSKSLGLTWKTLLILTLNAHSLPAYFIFLSLFWEKSLPVPNPSRPFQVFLSKYFPATPYSISFRSPEPPLTAVCYKTCSCKTWITIPSFWE